LSVAWVITELPWQVLGVYSQLMAKYIGVIITIFEIGEEKVLS